MAAWIRGDLLSASIFNLTAQRTSHDGIYAKHTKQVNYSLILRKVGDWGKGLAVCSEKHNLLPSDVLPAEDNFLHRFPFSEMFVGYQQMFLFYKKILKLLHRYIEGRGSNHLQISDYSKNTWHFFHHLSKEKQCFELPCAETSGVKKVLFIHIDLNQQSTLKSLNSTRLKI